MLAALASESHLKAFYNTVLKWFSSCLKAAFDFRRGSVAGFNAFELQNRRGTRSLAAGEHEREGVELLLSSPKLFVLCTYVHMQKNVYSIFII